MNDTNDTTKNPKPALDPFARLISHRAVLLEDKVMLIQMFTFPSKPDTRTKALLDTSHHSCIHIVVDLYMPFPLICSTSRSFQLHFLISTTSNPNPGPSRTCPTPSVSASVYKFPTSCGWNSPGFVHSNTVCKPGGAVNRKIP